MQDRVFYEVEVRTVNQEPPFVGEYFFHTECWDDIWQDFVTYRKKIRERAKSSEGLRQEIE